MVIDELVVRLILDTTGFKQGQKDAAAASEQMAASLVASAGKGEKAQTDAAGRIVKALERIADQGDKLASEQEDQHKRVAEATNKTSVSVEGLARKFLGLYALVTAGRGLREFVSELTTADSALGRTARNIDMGVKSLSTFQLAAEASGGSAAGITGTMQSLSAELQRAALTGQSSVAPAFQAMGINLADAGGKARNVRDIFRDLNRFAQTVDPARFSALANLAGISDEGTINLLEKTTQEYDALLAAQEKYAVTAADADAAQKRQTGWRELLVTSTAIGRTILTAVTPAIVGVMKAVQDWADRQDWTKVSKSISDFLDKVSNDKNLDAFGKRVEDFVTKVDDIATAADNASKGFDGNSLLFKGLEGLAALIGLRLIGSVLGLTVGLRALGAIPVTGLLARLITNPLVVGGAAVALGASAESTPDADTQKRMDDFYKSHPDATANPFVALGRWWKGNAATWAGGDSPEAKARAEDVAKRQADVDAATAAANAKSGQGGGFWAQTWAYLKGKVGLGDDPKVKDSVEATAKATTGIFNLMRAQRDGVGADAEAGAGGGGGGGGGGPANMRYGRGPGGGYRSSPESMNFAGFGKGGWEKSGANKQQVADYSKHAFAAQGIDPSVALRIANAEGLHKYEGDFGTSFGAFQLHYGGSGIRGMNSGGLGDRFTKETGLDARDPTTWRAQVDYAAKIAKREGWGAWHGRFPAHVGLWDGIGTYTGPVPPAPAPTAATAAPGTPAPSAAAVTDAEVFAARQRLLNGSRDPKDHAIVSRYLKDQNTPPAAPKVAKQYPGWMSPSPDGQGYSTTDMRDPRFAPHAPTLHHAIHAALVAIGHANKLLSHGGGEAVPVDITERGANRIARPLNEMLRHRAVGAGRAHYNHDIQRAMDHTAALRDLMRVAAFHHSLSRTVNNTDRSSRTKIGSIAIHTPATDAPGLMADLDRHLARSREVTQLNSGLA